MSQWRSLLGAAFHFGSVRPKAIQSLAVLPFRNLGAGAPDEYFTDSMTDAATTQLAKLGRLSDAACHLTELTVFFDNSRDLTCLT